MSKKVFLKPFHNNEPKLRKEENRHWSAHNEELCRLIG